MKDIIVNNRYRVDYKIGEGGFGLVYAGTDIGTKTQVAIKFSPIENGSEVLQYEADTYAVLSGSVGIPQLVWFGPEGDFYSMVHELLGASLGDLFRFCNEKFSLKTILLIADQVIRRIKHIHDRGYLHCDIKPENFLLGLGRKGNVIYTIDFGLARDMDADDGNAIHDNRALGGTDWYASINNHNRLAQSRGDDLESLGYVLLHLARGSLPWQNLKASTDEEHAHLIKQMKSSIKLEHLCHGLPEEFAAYMAYARALKPIEKPNYSHLLRLFRQLFAARGFKHDNVFDWTEKIFNELQESNLVKH